MSIRDSQTEPLMPDVGVIAVVAEQWGSMWLSRQQILTRMARYFHVIWVDPQLGWQKLWFGNESSVTRNPDSTMPTASGFTVCRQSALLPKLYSPAFLGTLTARRHLGRARAQLMSRGCKKVILYVWRPEFGSAIEMVDHEISCYHIVDEYSFSSVESPISEEESALISRVDQVFIHSPALMEKKGDINPNTEYVTNGVDYDAFTTPAPEPSDLAGIAHPRIGYIGRIKIQLDWVVLDHLSGQHPDWQFVFVGPMGHMGDCADIQDRVFARENVHYLGNKSVVDIPSYTQHVDVCLLSYTLNNYTKYIFPLKLHECLAAGKAVVGSDIRSLRDFDSVIKIAKTPEEWSSHIAAALSATDATVAEVRRSVAKDFDWDHLVHRIATTLCARIGESFLVRMDDIGGVDSAHGPSAT